jgi:ribosomal-protein-alanine N-acetyltransferase
MRVGYFCWVYESSEGVVGYGIMSVGAGECHLLNLCIHPDYQRRGLGRHMIEKLIDTARHHRARMAFLEVRQSNRGAYCLYQKLGFDEVGVRKDYYPARSGREDAFILARII